MTITTERTGGRARLRRPSGSTLVEGVAGFVALTMVGAFSICLLMNVAVAVYYKQKLCFVTNQAAAYAASLRCWNHGYARSMSDVQNRTQHAVNEMLQEIGLPAGSVQVTEHDSMLTTSVMVQGFVMPTRNVVLPGVIALSDSATADLSANEPSAHLFFGQNNNRNKIVAIPGFGFTAEASPRSTWSNPYHSFTFVFDSGMEFQEGQGHPTVMSPSVQIPDAPGQ